ncbi:MAG: hypothetical protein ACI9TV_001051 [Sulfurimonas sp.]|jgi:uncharacterized protein (DUF302 family)|uniref:DUF302 domain-containing protein n=1 Tax=Sulfurimonas sp. TaxID=2022749 RepID=UPI0039E4EEA5
MKAIVVLFTMVGILIAGGFESSEVKNGNFHIYTVDNKDANIRPKMIEDALKSNGFLIGENANIQAELLHIYKEDNFKIYNNISFYHKDITLKLLNKHSDAGVLVPMGMVVYQHIGEDDLHIVVVRADMQAKVIGVKPQELQTLEVAILKVITTLFPTAIHTYNDESKAQPREFLTKYTLDFKDADFEDVREELEENFEEKFTKAGFAMPSYFDLAEGLGKDSPYDFYVTYAICKMDVLRVVIKVNPEVPVLGPCTTMIYKKKNEKKIVMGFASIYNWISSANIEDKVAVDGLLETQRIYEAILKDVTKTNK